MLPTIQCPTCQARLKMPEPVLDVVMVCPQCRSTILNSARSEAKRSSLPQGAREGQLPRIDADALLAVTHQNGSLEQAARPNYLGTALLVCLSAMVGVIPVALGLYAFLRWCAELVYDYRGGPPLGEPVAAAIVVSLIVIVAVAIQQLCGPPSAIPRTRTQAAVILVVFAVIGALVLAFVALLILGVVVCTVTEGLPRMFP